MIVPTIATIVVGTNGLVGQLDTAEAADRARILAGLSQDAGELTHDLQQERALGMILRGSTDKDKTRWETSLAAFGEINKKVDADKLEYQRGAQALADLPASFSDLLGDIDTGLGRLQNIRDSITAKSTSSGTPSTGDITTDYSTIIGDLIRIRESSAQLANDSQLSERMRAGAAIATAKEFLSKERILVHKAFDQKGMTPLLRYDYIGTIVGGQQALESFSSIATTEEKEYFETKYSGTAVREFLVYQGYLSALNGDSLETLKFDDMAWDQATSGASDLMRQVEEKVDADIEVEATAVRDQVTQRMLVETGLLLGMLLLAILFAWLVARSMARSLRELRHGALAVAQYGLPQAVARLRDPALSSSLSPAQVANQIAEPLPVRSKDEFGQVTEAFNAVHLEAVRTAAEQAALRSSVATMFVNLARRSQILVDRLIGHLDRLERGEEDPDRLGELFQLDHLATRMRRNDENLLVLAGADSTRVQRDPASLVDVLRAAQSEVEHYTRIEFGIVDRDIEVSAHAVNDLVHLVAELFDNATAFSPPDSIVMVEARRVGDRAVLYVEDHGIGISPDLISDINERLATPPLVDVAVSRMMGLVVVARLGARHGVKVELRPAADRGTIADVTLPTAVLVPRALAGRGQPVNRDIPAPPRQQQVPPRSPFAAPLALESGPVARSEYPVNGNNGSPIGGGLGSSFGGGANGRNSTNGSGNGAAPAAPGRFFDAPAAPADPVLPTSLQGGGSRSMPAWSDLTGANGKTPTPTPDAGNGTDVDPLPQRRSADAWPTVDGEIMGDEAEANIPRQTSSSPETRTPYVPAGSMPPEFPVSGVPISGVPVSVAPVSVAPVSAAPVSVVPVSATPAPPVWPPVQQEVLESTTAGSEQLAATMSRTSEIPRIVDDAPQESYPAAARPSSIPYVPPAPAMPDRRTPYADETMELPIFRELESAWFRTRKPAAGESITPEEAEVDITETAQFPAVDVSARVGEDQQRPMSTTTGGAGMASSTQTTTVPAGYQVPAPYMPAWQTDADDGWAAATAAASAAEVPLDTTETGLPKRVPMAQLVPGGVEKGAAAVQRRTPEGVRGLLSAYHRGVQRGRTQQDESFPGSANPAGQQAGKEHEA
ncbi:signal transduction histidine kinase [Allocatelliglobosispora scoriae]|uniref:histidine kinase n=1 Tax=Allocatelliglobosispora scoriae TaxID=643052 RepID=A0A841BRT5_9ACTN|nr:sensor histidine kinase [Allocatelliglobosispora scoriae]MBB5870415.1 signal transduction histidine kinase [Allocatelliglobosispora scoriae]